MSKVKTAINLLKHEPRRLVLALAKNHLLDWMSDENYLRFVFYSKMGKKLNLENPTTYNEKLQWLKIHDRRPEYITYADKYAVREFYKQTIGEEYLIPLIGVYDKVEDIPWEELPSQFVLKCNHGSGCNIICKDKSKLDIENAKQRLQRWMRKNYFWSGREWQYKTIQPRIICEVYLVDESGYELKDYKFHCCNGEPKFINVVLNRSSGINANFYDSEWNPLPFEQHYPRSSTELAKPKTFDKMVEIARILSQNIPNIPYIRVDFYDVKGHLYIGELTLRPGNGWLKFNPESDDELIGRWIELPLEIG